MKRSSKIIFFPVRANLLHSRFLVSARKAPPYQRLLKIEPHPFLPVSELEFSSHFLECVRTAYTIRWLL